MAPERTNETATKVGVNRRQRGKNLAIALTVAMLVALFYAVTVIKLSNLPR